jgi:SNF2 family DNA or RNA helicase
MRGATQALSKVPSKPSKLSGLLNRLQSQAVDLSLSVDGCLVLFDQRTGKTLITLRVLQLSEPTDTLLIVRKTNLVSTWETQIKEHLPQYSIFKSFVEYQAHQKDFVKAWGTRDHCILLTNYEALPSVYKRLRKYSWSLTIYDEVQSLKSRSSRNARNAKGLVQMSERRLALTGTPLDQSPIEMFSIMRFVEPEALGYTWREFEDEYLIKKKINWSKIKGEMMRRRVLIGLKKYQKRPKFKIGKLDQFYQRVAPYVIRVTQEDMGIKPPIINEVPVYMGGDQRRAYDELEREMVVEVDDTIILAPMKVTKLVKLQQITGGFIFDEDRDVHRIGKAKLGKLVSLIKRLEPPVVIFCKFRPEIELLKSILPGRVAELHGGIKDKKTRPVRTQTIQDFQQGGYDYLICQQRTGGVGVDLYHARRAIIYSMGHSGIDYRQMMARLTHLHQEEPPEFWILYVPDTIDQDILVALEEKRVVFDVTMERLKENYK